MTRTLVHRGPDDAGAFIEEGVGLGIRRLSVIDVDGGRQPIASEDGSVVVVCNGEIYNFRELRERLRSRGHVFRTRSDVECVAHLYEDRGPAFAEDLRGMFAIALFDRGRRRLVLVRDRLGKKPLFYAQTPGRIVFGSEIKAIRAAAPDLGAVDVAAIQPFLLFGFIPEPRTIYSVIRKLPPGHLLEYDGDRVSVRPYWDLRLPSRRIRNPHDRAAVARARDELDARLEEAVRLRLESDVPLGAFLSGGPDSSLVVAYMSRLLRSPVRTFTIAFEERSFDESRDAQRVAERWGTTHRVLTLRMGDMRENLFSTVDAIARCTDEPFGDSSSLPMYHVSRLARREATVVLAGDGADEIFGGYTIYQGLRFASLFRRWPAALRAAAHAAAGAWVAGSPPGPGRWRAQRWAKRLADSERPLVGMLASKFSLTAPAQVGRLFPAGLDLLSDEERSGARWIDTGGATDPFDQTLHATTRFLMVNDMLVKVDRMSMAHGLEVRCPYLDTEVIEFAAALPPALKLRGWETKALLRDVARRYLPAENAGKAKHGFGVPISLWFRGPLAEGVRMRLLDSAAVAEYLDRTAVAELLERHRRGAEDHGQTLWCLLAFDAWHRASTEVRL
jgi:asparagine synthase (glutamine-hydrolysing)